MLFTLFPTFQTTAVADSNVITYDEVTARISAYMDQCAGRYWNKGYGQQKLMDLASSGDYVSATKTTSIGFSNKFTGQSTCLGFASYLSYVIFGKEKRTENGWSDPIESISDDEVVHPGDYIYYPRLKSNGQKSQHGVIVYKVEGDTVYLADCNWGAHCIIRCDRSMSMSEIRESINRSLKGDHGFYRKSPAVERTDFAVTLADYADAKIEPIGASQTLRTIPAGTTVTVTDYTVNDYMNLWFKTDAGDWISSNYPITRVYAYVSSSSGQIVMNYSADTNTYEYNVKTDGLNNSFKFGSLGSGSYTYVLGADDSSGATVSISSSFDIGYPDSSSSSSSDEYPLNSKECWMTVNVGKGSTLRFCSTVSIADQYEIGSIPNGASVYVYGTTTQQYENRTWAKISYNGTDGWVNYKWLA